jgi:hypothetical protein
MYYPALKRAIQALEEKAFYQIALMYLTAIGYRDVSIIDGPGDGGRDVVCSRTDLRIQLSVRKDWENKINSESKITKAAGKHSFVYVTNRVIADGEEQMFKASKHINKGDVDVTVHDLNRIATTLARSGNIKAAYAALGMSVDKQLQASEKEIATSTLMLFSMEAQDFRTSIVESNVRACLLKNEPAAQDRIISAVADLLPYPAADNDIRRAIGRMKANGRISEQGSKFTLSDAEAAIAEAAEEEFRQSTSADLELLQEKHGLAPADADTLLRMAIELIARDKPLDERSAQADALADFVSDKGLARKRAELYEDLSKTTTARLRQYAKTVDKILSTDTFDIYRALGLRTHITMILDASVAMPMLCGLAFGSVRSRFGIAASALRHLCQEHEIEIKVPSFYVNEMASHGLKARDYIATYESLPAEARDALIASNNAYLSHYVRLKDSMTAAGEVPPSLEEFLGYFGFTARATLTNAENKVISLLDSFAIKTIPSRGYDAQVRERVRKAKNDEPPVIIDHDAMAITLLQNDTDSGFVFATWDQILIEMVAAIDRIYADTPARVIDFMSMAASARYECDQSIDLLTSLIHCDEVKARALAKKIDGIQSAEQAFRLRKFIDDSRKHAGVDWQFTDREAAAFFQQDIRQEEQD